MEVANEKEKSLSFADILGVLRSRIIWIIAITVLCTVIGGVYAFAFKKPTYTAKLNAMIYVETYKNQVTEEDKEVDEHIRYQYASLIAEEIGTFLLSPTVLNACGQDLKGSLSVTPTEDQPVFTVTYTYQKKGGDSNLVKAEVAETLNKFMDKAVEFMGNSDDGTDRFKWYSGKIVVFSEAQPKDVSASTGKLGVILIAFAIGLVLSVIFVLVKNAFDDTITTKEQIEAITGNQIIATIDISSSHQEPVQKPTAVSKKEGN